MNQWSHKIFKKIQYLIWVIDSGHPEEYFQELFQCLLFPIVQLLVLFVSWVMLVTYWGNCNISEIVGQFRVENADFFFILVFSL